MDGLPKNLFYQNRKRKLFLVMIRNLLIFIVCGLFSCSCLHAKSRVTPPLIWNINKIDDVNNDVKYSKLKKHIVSMADSFCVAYPIVITGTDKHFIDNSHYYCSTGPYWWPDTTDAGIIYIRRDGYINPDYYSSDSEKIKEIAKRCKYLSVAYYLTNKKKYYRAYIKQIRAWFIDKDTYMYPNFEYAQVIPGQNMNKGRSTGLIEAYSLNTVLESFRLISLKIRIDKKTLNGMIRWMTAFSIWMHDSTYGIKQSQAPTNLSIAYDVTLINLNAFCGRIRDAIDIAKSFYDKRILTQITEDGLQPLELSRTKAYMYSVFNLSHIVDFLTILNRLDYALFKSISLERVDSAFSFLLQFVDNGDAFPYQELNRTKWSSCTQSCISEWDRYLYLINQKDYDIPLNQALTSAFSTLVN